MATRTTSASTSVTSSDPSQHTPLNFDLCSLRRQRRPPTQNRGSVGRSTPPRIARPGAAALPLPFSLFSSPFFSLLFFLFLPLSSSRLLLLPLVSSLSSCFLSLPLTSSRFLLPPLASSFFLLSSPAYRLPPRFLILAFFNPFFFSPLFFLDSLFIIYLFSLPLHRSRKIYHS